MMLRFNSGSFASYLGSQIKKQSGKMLGFNFDSFASYLESQIKKQSQVFGVVFLVISVKVFVNSNLAPSSLDAPQKVVGNISLVTTPARE